MSARKIPSLLGASCRILESHSVVLGFDSAKMRVNVGLQAPGEYGMPIPLVLLVRFQLTYSIGNFRRSILFFVTNMLWIFCAAAFLFVATMRCLGGKSRDLQSIVCVSCSA